MNPQTTTPQSMEQRVLQAIQQQKLAMHAKWRIVLPHVLIIACAVLLALIAILHTSSLLYGFQLNGSWNLLRADLGNITYVLRAFPWLLAGIPLFLLVALIAVLRRTTRVYRLPLLYTIVAIPLVVVGVSVLIEQIPGHEELQNFTTSSIPVVGGLYRNVAEREPAETYIGEVRNVNGNGFTLINRKGETIPVEMSASSTQAQSPAVANTQVVQVVGKANGGKVNAKKIEKVPAHFQDDVRERVEKAEQQKLDAAEEREEEDAERRTESDTQREDERNPEKDED